MLTNANTAKNESIVFFIIKSLFYIKLTHNTELSLFRINFKHILL
jgi:hypothetical protein